MNIKMNIIYQRLAKIFGVQRVKAISSAEEFDAISVTNLCSQV